MVFEQLPKPSQFPDGLVVGFGDNGPAAEEQPQHIFGNGDSGGRGLSGQFFVFPGARWCLHEFKLKPLTISLYSGSVRQP